MKIQVRQGVFETNSSSVHTLTIKKHSDITNIREMFNNVSNAVKAHVRQHGLEFKTMWLSNCPAELNSYIENMNSLVEMFSGYNTSKVGFVHAMDNMRKIASEIGVEFHMDEESVADHDWCDIPTFDGIFDNANSIAAFLFDDNSVMTEMDNNYSDEEIAEQLGVDKDNYELFVID